MSERKVVAVDGVPQGKYSKNFRCPKCGKYYTDHEKVEVTYYKLPVPDTIAGIIPKEGAIEVHCPCGIDFWNHIDLDMGVAERDIIVPPKVKAVVFKSGKRRGTHHFDACDFTKCKYCHDKKCMFGGWNTGLGCAMDMSKEEFDDIVQTMINSRTVRAYAEMGDQMEKIKAMKKSRRPEP